MLDRFKKNRNASEEDGMDIITEVKEPFSMSNFFRTQIVERAKNIKNTLAEKGILFFLFSPFQARNRLIAQICILCVGIVFGVIPRASTIVNGLQNKAFVSEIDGLSSKTVGDLTITPAASSNYQRMHLLAFVASGENLPSDASKYEVHLARSYGASDWANVTYSWTVYPLMDGKRIILVAIDQTKQPSGYGAFDLYIQLSGEEVSDYAKTPFEVTLSSAQETTDLYNRSGIHMWAITEDICGVGKIADKQKSFEEALGKYQVALEQTEAMPVDITVSPTREELENYCLANRVYRMLDDASTTKDIPNIRQVDKKPDIGYDVVLTADDITYDSELIEELKKTGIDSAEYKIIFEAFTNVDNAKKSVISAMDGVNDAAMSWYNTLSNFQLILNQNVNVDSFPLHARCTNVIEDEIDFIEGSAADTYEEPEASYEDVSDGVSDNE